MAYGNTVTVVGNLGDDPELRYTPSGMAVASFRMAVSYKKKDSEQEQTSWFKVTVWRDQGENVAESLNKGDRVIVTGRLDERRWETQEGDNRSVVEIQAEAVGPSLQWATAEVTRQSRSNEGGQ